MLSKNFEINILDQLFNVYLQNKNTFKKELPLIYLDANYKHSNCIKKMCLCVEVGFVGFILKRTKYFE